MTVEKNNKVNLGWSTNDWIVLIMIPSDIRAMNMIMNIEKQRDFVFPDGNNGVYIGRI